VVGWRVRGDVVDPGRVPAYRVIVAEGEAAGMSLSATIDDLLASRPVLSFLLLSGFSSVCYGLVSGLGGSSVGAGPAISFGVALGLVVLFVRTRTVA